MLMEKQCCLCRNFYFGLGLTDAFLNYLGHVVEELLTTNLQVTVLKQGLSLLRGALLQLDSALCNYLLALPDRLENVRCRLLIPLKDFSRVW